MPNSSFLAPSALFLLPNTFRAFYGSFQQLYPIQQRAIEPILDGRDVIIQSATGSGKTEAVLAPCIERIITAAEKASILYIVPTRALAVDIFRRFETILTERLGLTVAIRTGDIKKNGGGFPAIMLSTPESLDVMLGSSNQDISGFLARINTVVIDEVHPFIHHYRGHHLVYLLKRLERRCKRKIQKIALSATLADPYEVSRFLRCGSETEYLIETVSRRIVPRLVHLLDDEGELIALLDDLYHQWNYHKILIFANSRGRCDRIFGVLNQNGVFRQMALLHYSNLAAGQRREVERRFRKQSRAVCVATSTLELGIDVGDVDAVVLFEPPDSAAAFLQRIGRANRRQAAIHFWGICRGERSGEQVLRFLALLYLTRRGRVETPLPKRLPSVLSQQIISLLYEKKCLSLAALKSLFFPDDNGDDNILDKQFDIAPLLDDIFGSLVTKKWLRQTHINGIYSGGWRYGEALLGHRIWSNFPETEKEYSLIVSGEAVADIPLSIVRQLDVGDKVLLTGRRLHILWIDEGRNQCVLAEPTEEKLDAKEILWVGMGCYVSLETAQAMRDVLKSQDPADNRAADGLFARTRKLIEKQLERDQKAVLLANSIEVVVTNGGFYQYRTFLGAVGNMILAQSIKEYFAKRSQDVYLLYDEIGLSCSDWVHFEQLTLPLSPKKFEGWIANHFKTVRAMFPLNAFGTTLPPEILQRELTDFIMDRRLMEFFRKIADSSSDIVQGDPRHLKPSSGLHQEKPPDLIEMKTSHEPFLGREKKRYAANLPKVSLKEAFYRIRPLTGTIMGDYFRHGQCRRWLCFRFLQPYDQPLKQNQADDALAVQRMARGLAFETKLLDELQGLGRNFDRIIESDDRGRSRSLESRYKETCDWLRRACRQNPDGGRRYLAQGVLMQAALLAPTPSRFDSAWDTKPILKGIGIPDLICAVYGRDNVELEVGDIKSSLRPRYHQKWQVAFYAYLLNTYLQQEKDQLRVRPADTGFLLVPSSTTDTPQRHDFDLSPYLTTINTVFKNLEECLSASHRHAFWRLQNHCVGCPYFEFCYQQALTEEDIQFIPRLSHGELLKLRALKLHDMGAAAAWFADHTDEKRLANHSSERSSVNRESDGKGTRQAPFVGNDPSDAFDDGHALMVATNFSPAQKERLKTAVTALIDNKIIFDNRETQLYPAATKSCFFVHLLNDPITMRPIAFGVGQKKYNQDLKIYTRMAAPGSNPFDLLREFSSHILKHWQESVAEKGTPHIFLFGKSLGQRLYEWAALMQDAPLGRLFRPGQTAEWTDLAQVLGRHFALPIPGRMTRFALAHLLGLGPGQTLDAPDSLFHADRPFDRKTDSNNIAEVKAYLATMLTFDLQLYQWITTHLKSDWRKERWSSTDPPKQNMGEIYQRFIAAEKRYQERDLKHLQTLSLTERVARFRALGPLKFGGTTLDQEGRFLYTFTSVDPKKVEISKFRKGDFLKLVPQGLEDLQSGMPVIMAHYNPSKSLLSLYSRQKGSIHLTQNIFYSLEEDGDDWNTPKLIEVVQNVYAHEAPHPVREVLCGRWHFTQPVNRQQWVHKWLLNEGKQAHLNPSQQTALKLPFQYALSLIQGPPGTGKTSLLGWILIALIRQAEANQTPLRIAVSALTHQAIDQVLTKVVTLVNIYNLNYFPARCWKLGHWDGPEFDQNSAAMQVQAIDTFDQIVFPNHLILGATGYALYNQMQRSADTFSDKPFDWIIFDEASQILGPYAMLSLIYGKGNYLFLGDIHQLPPVIRSPRLDLEDTSITIDNIPAEKTAYHSILKTLMQHYPKQSGLLETTYRMNAELCDFPSRTWYDGKLHPTPKNAAARLSLAHPISSDDPLDNIIDPDKPVVLVRTHHLCCDQESGIEANIIARIAHHLLCRHNLLKEQLAIISPHRAQNNAISSRLSELLKGEKDLPLIDTVERIQGAERDVILFGLTSSDPDQVLGEFLNNPKRFNVAITRARKKLIVVCSETFISAVAQNEKALEANACFKAFFEHISAEANIIWQAE
jgi:superfamily II DNA/RNA helicase